MNDCQTVMNNVSTTYTTVFHFLITSISLNSQLLNLMNTWKLHNMEYHFYSCGNHLTDIWWIQSRHPSGAKPFLKLMITEILPSTINKSIGIGLEQNPHFQEVMTKLESNWKVSLNILIHHYICNDLHFVLFKNNFTETIIYGRTVGDSELI
ncbi:LARGE xylosyl- and glucuronyltransferase 2, variant 2 [Schistosoma haematobium]|uniref:LARGE xylosyl- and glucuronyltransferase 2, variant 2 n=1 Tax=Schistosoma haematobium TaxID=6185 RepID=A0A922IL77_SCHHA|nr:LARGE xylosyl- and glucuronyltransferase 2, variant 2 [Schistosoma haematobium]KAH9581877.1 LARGE xylosyl- and glucuronyltransferase 2, variant 2 [Schistosoma haematobium]